MLPQASDAKSSSTLFDLFYGYNNRHKAMSHEEIEITINEFAEAARRVRETGADAVSYTHLGQMEPAHPYRSQGYYRQHHHIDWTR